MSAVTIRLRLFGAPAVFGPDGAPAGAALADPHRLALLALLALHPKRTVSRGELAGYLWPARSVGEGKQALNQALFAISKALGDDAIFPSAKEIRLGATVAVDALDFRAALEAGRAADAMKLYSAPLMEGFELDDAPEFQRWAALQRERFATAARTQRPVSDAPVEDLHDLSDIEIPEPTPAPEPPPRKEPQPRKSTRDFTLLEEPDVVSRVEQSAEGPALSAKAPPPPDVMFDPAPAEPEPEPEPPVSAAPTMPELMSNSVSSEPARDAIVPPRVSEEFAPVIPPEPPPRDEVRWVEPPPPPPPVLETNLAPPPATPPSQQRVSTTAAAVAPSETKAKEQPAKRPRRPLKLPSARLVVTVLVVAALGAAGYFGRGWITGTTREGIAAARARAEAAQLAKDRTRSIAVLPIEYAGRDKADSALATKVVAELTPMLTRAGLIVAPGAALARRGPSNKLRAITDSLNVAYVLEGVMQREGDRIAFRFRLLSPVEATARWEDTYRPRLADIQALEEDVTATVASQILREKP